MVINDKREIDKTKQEADSRYPNGKQVGLCSGFSPLVIECRVWDNVIVITCVILSRPEIKGVL